MTTEQELALLKNDHARLRDLLDHRPALNAHLVEAYMEWTRLCYVSDATMAGRHEAEVH